MVDGSDVVLFEDVAAFHEASSGCPLADSVVEFFGGADFDVGPELDRSCCFDCGDVHGFRGFDQVLAALDDVVLGFAFWAGDDSSGEAGIDFGFAFFVTIVWG